MHTKQQLCKSPSATIAVTAALAIAIVFAVAAVPALAQNAVPPTARQAASSPAFAARLAHQAGAQKAGKTRAHGSSCAARPSPQDQFLYDNGPFNGTTDAWTINFGLSTSDSFTGGGPVTGLHFVYWDASTSDLLTTVDIQVGSTSFGGTPQTLTGVTNTFLGTNQYGYALFKADYSFSDIGYGSYVTLSNACTTSGCSVSNPIYWDENSGVGCTSQGCPSTAYENNLGSIPSESFSLDGNGPPPPPPCFEPDDYLQVLHDFTGDDLGGWGANGVTVNKAGDLYGTAGGGNYGAGMLYKLARGGQDWLFTPLYSFTGDYNGGGPSPVIIGPDGALYGTASGGIKACGSSGNDYCGLVFRLSPGPVACRTSLCGWTEQVLYRFTGNDAWNPNGNLAFDQAGNLYGTTAYGPVFELTPSRGGWTEKVIYTFPGGSGGAPSSLFAGKDGNLYGITPGSWGDGIVFQLVPSAGGWIENTLYVFQGGTDGSSGGNLGQDSSGDLYGTEYVEVDCGYYYAVVFKLSPSQQGWVFAWVDLIDYGRNFNVINNFVVDRAGNFYFTFTHLFPFWIGYGYLYDWSAVMGGGAYWYTHDYFDPSGPLAVDSSHIYGTTRGCGRYQHGTLWSLPY